MPKRELQLEEMADDFAQVLVDETLKLLESHGHTHGEKFTRILVDSYLSHFIGALVFTSLKEEPKDGDKHTKETLYKFTEKNYKRAKTDVQEAVAMGFQNAMIAYSGQVIDYYCQVKTAANTNSKKVC